jgi:hypothetical protein
MVMGLDRSIQFLEKRKDLLGYLIYSDSAGISESGIAPVSRWRITITF